MKGMTNRPILDPCDGGGWIKMGTVVNILKIRPKGNGIKGNLARVSLLNGVIYNFPEEDIDIFEDPLDVAIVPCYKESA
jgi:hypothetical protein